MSTHAEQIARRCKHFNGVQREKCEAGVVYLTVKATDGEPKGLGSYPCFREGESIPCDKRQFPTPEEVAAEVAESEKEWERMKLAIGAASEDAKKHGFKKGNGGKGSIPCPVCTQGTLHYTVAAYNGHIWGKCTTADCVFWIQ